MPSVRFRKEVCQLVDALRDSINVTGMLKHAGVGVTIYNWGKANADNAEVPESEMRSTEPDNPSRRPRSSHSRRISSSHRSSLASARGSEGSKGASASD